MTSPFDAPYLQWTTTRAAARFDLAGSAVLGCNVDDLVGARDAIALTSGGESGNAALVSAIAERYFISPVQVTTAHGASGANFLVCAALLEPGDEVIVERPGYDALLAGPALLGAQILRVDRDFDAGFPLDPERVRRLVTPRTRLIVVTSPHNPSGVIASPEALAAIGQIAQASRAHVLVDEVYLDASVSPARLSPPPHAAAKAGDLFIRTSSLTKSYGLSGLRCGWILASPAIAARLQRVRDIVEGVAPVVTERLAVLAFSQIDRILERSRRLLDTNGPIVRDFLRSRTDLEWVEPGGGTVVFPRIRDVADASRFAEHLLSHRDTAVVPGRFFDAPAHFRLGFGGRTDDLRSGLDALGAALDAQQW